MLIIELVLQSLEAMLIRALYHLRIMKSLESLISLVV